MAQKIDRTAENVRDGLRLALDALAGAMAAAIKSNDPALFDASRAMYQAEKLLARAKTDAAVIASARRAARAA